MIRLLRLALEGLRALGGHRLRTGFMMAGTTLGIASLTVVMAMNDGARAQLEENLQQFGADTFRIRAGGGRMQGGGMRSSTLTLEDARAIALELPGIKLVSPILFIHEASVGTKSNTENSIVLAVTEDFFQTSGNTVAAGRSFTTNELDSMGRVCLLGPTVQNRLFPDEDPLGKKVRINKINFEVVGLMTPRGTMPNGMDFDDRVVMPLTTGMKRVFRSDFVSGIEVVAQDKEQVEALAAKASALLRERHRIDPNQEDDFRVMTAAAIADFHLQTVNQLSLLLAALAVLCLVVGGVVQMNILLVSVGERTSEIGLRRALGASSRDVFLQFLTEALVVNLLGMALGVALGSLGFVIISRLVPQMAAVFSFRGLGLAAVFSLVVGLGFGTLPARRASSLSPVEALR